MKDYHIEFNNGTFPTISGSILIKANDIGEAIEQAKEALGAIWGLRITTVKEN